MANLNNPIGLIPHGQIYRASAYKAAGIIRVGDAVALDSDGYVATASAGATPLVGAALSSALTAGDTVMVADDPKQLFVIKASSTQVDAQTDINLNYNIVATAGSSVYKCSRHALDSSSGVSDSNMPLKLLAIDPRPNNALGAYVDCVVVINNHSFKGDTGTLGV
jgi:hypothetical protein